jgi:nucleotide-binding universal stress UspA family protein
MKRILVATDGSAGADRSLDVASRIASCFGAELIIVTVEQGYLQGDLEEFRKSEDATPDEVLNGAALEILKHAKERAHSNGVSRVRTYSSLGDAVAFILEVAEREKADTIVVGKRGRGRLLGLLIGSVSQKLISLARCNVLVVP